MSGIYIPGERIPDTLTAFWIFPDGYVRVFGKNGDEIRGREAIPVPDHGRLIDAYALKSTVYEALKDAIHDDNATSCGAALCTFIAKNIVDEIESAPTIIPADKEGEG